MQTFQWRTVTPERQRLTQARLDALRSNLAERQTKTLLVVRNKRIIYEWYAPGYDAQTRHYTASLAKALVGGMSLLVALNDGLLSVDEPAHHFIPAWKNDPQKSKISIRHLATHTSGLSDSVTENTGHEDQAGWKGEFWQGRSDPEINPIEIAIHKAPLLFEPGTGYAYSNPGMAALALAVTGSLRHTAHPDIRTLLNKRIMEPIGVPCSSWQIGYGQTYRTNKLDVCANWGGGSFTARAVARIGLLMLQRGMWEEQRIIQESPIKQMLSYAGMPLPDRPPGNPQPGSGLCWYTNFDGVWPTLPRDTFAGAGAGNQVLLVVPSRDLIVVRNGGQIDDPKQGEGFWGGLLDHLFTPLMDTFLDRLPTDAQTAPYPPSPVVCKITFDPPSTITRKGFHSDNWPITWGDDDHQYTAYGDGRGFKPFVEQMLSLGFVQVTGPANTFYGVNIRSENGERQGHNVTGAKASGMLMVDGVLYMLARNTGNSQIAWSTDHGKTWIWADWTFQTSMGCPTFLNFGRDYADARDGFVYVYSHDADSAYDAADHMVLARAPKDQLTERSAWAFFQRLTPQGHPIWTANIEARGSVFSFDGHCRRSGISYNAGIRRYLWWQQFSETDVDTRFQGGFGIYDAPEPWGPWTTAYLSKEWDCGPGETGSFPPKWMSADGTICHLVFSGNDCFSVRKAILTVRKDK